MRDGSGVDDGLREFGGVLADVRQRASGDALQRQLRLLDAQHQ